MALQDEIEEKSGKIFRDSYQMSIGELINLYRDGEMDVHPEFQRVFRWNDYQKTKLIESIMLNIPIPSIFVNQNEDGVWDIIDGVQRLSTIFQFVGIFKDEEDKKIPALVLQKTDYLPSFKDVQWDNSNSELSFTKEQQLFFKRARIDIVIMKKESDPNTKYELFQRLNTGGTQLSDQEVRNCLMIMTNKSFYEFISSLEKIEHYKSCIPITDRKVDEQLRTELVLRLIVAKYIINWETLSQYSELSELLDKETLKLCEMEINYSQVLERFNKTFILLNEVLGEDTFKRYNGQKHFGPFLISAFQGIGFGVFENIEEIMKLRDYKEWLKEKIQSFSTKDVFLRNISSGVKAIPRYKELSLFGVEYFKP